MFRKIILAVVGGLAVLSVSCATATITSYRDPDLKRRIRSIAVFYPSSDLAMRKELEEEAVECLEDLGVEAVSTLDVYPPTKEYDSNEFLKALQKEKVEAILVTTAAEAQATTHRTPDQYYFNPRTGMISNFGGVTYTTHSAQSNVELVDLKEGKRVWMASIHSKGDTAGLVSSAMVSKTCNRLLADGVIPTRSRKTPRPCAGLVFKAYQDCRAKQKAEDPEQKD